MKQMFVLGLLVLAFIVGPKSFGSDPAGIYAKVERVEFLPDEKNPDKVKVWGTFSVSVGAPATGGSYSPATYGYLFYSPKPGSLNVNEQWKALAASVGKESCVAFGRRYGANGVLRLGAWPAEGADYFPTDMAVASIEMKDRRCDKLKTVMPQ